MQAMNAPLAMTRVLQGLVRKPSSIFKPLSRDLDIGYSKGSTITSTIARPGHLVTGIDSATSVVKLSQKPVPTSNFEAPSVLEYDLKQRMEAVLNTLSLSLLSRGEVESMSRKMGRLLVPDWLLCLDTIATEPCNPPRELYDEDGLCAHNIGFHVIGQKVGVIFLKLVDSKLCLREMMCSYRLLRQGQTAKCIAFITTRRTFKNPTRYYGNRSTCLLRF